MSNAHDGVLDLSSTIPGWTVSNYAMRSGIVVTLQINMNRTGTNWSGNLNIHEAMPPLPEEWQPTRPAHGAGRTISSLTPFQIQVGGLTHATPTRPVVPGE